MSNFVSGTLNVKNNIVGINCVPQPNDDTGFIMQLNTQNITDYEYQNNLVSATFSGATINESVNVGWVIEIVASGDKKRIISVAGFTVTVESPWSVIPSPGDIYRLYKKTNVAVIYKPLLNKLEMGYTYNNSSDTSVDIFSQFAVSSAAYVAWANNILINVASFVTCFNFAWNTSVMSANAMNLAIYVDTVNIIQIQVTDGVTVFGSGTYGATGHYVMPLSMPVATTLLQLQVKGGRGTLVSAVLALS